ncbi:MAG: FtsX-like permease family protein [Bacteroides sp.]|nr:FtsX-like permease family protein [Bacteroides sp.]MCM1094657.1 FtsX-like permease family protein [Terasakiella sp.]
MNGFVTWFSRRLRLRGAGSASASTGAVIAVGGVALAVIIIELSLAIVTGFKSEIRRKVAGFNAPVSVTAPVDVTTGHTGSTFAASDSLTDIIRASLPEGARLCPTLRRQAMVKTDSAFAAVEFVARGIGHDPSFERSCIVEGTLPSDTASRPEIAVSTSLASKLGLTTGSRPYLYFFVDGEVKARRATVSGLYCSHFGEYDDAVAYTAMPLLEGLAATPQLTSIDIEGISGDDAIAGYSDRLQERLVGAWRAGELSTLHPVTNVYDTGALYFNWLELLDTNVVVIFILMLCVAGFTLISSLFIIVLDRIPTIGVLRALGTTKRTVSAIFLRLALRLAGAGVLVGNIVGLGLALMQQHLRVVPLDPEMYYLSYVPVLVEPLHMLLLNAGILAAIWLILIVPAGYAARIDPASAMHYE